jgi:hypothetical protein
MIAVQEDELNREFLRSLERHCPLTWKRIMDKRYCLPRHRVGDYANQLSLNNFYASWLFRSLQGSAVPPGWQDDLRRETWIINQALGLRSNRPTYFLKADHGAALMRTVLPEDLSFSDIRWRHPQIRILLPLNLTAFFYGARNYQGTYVSVELGRVDPGAKIRYPKELAQELDWEPLLCKFRQGLGPIQEIELNHDCNEGGVAMLLCYRRDPAEDTSDCLSAEFGAGCYQFRWSQRNDNLLKLSTEFEPTLQAPVKQEIMRNRIIHLAFQCLLYMSREEEILELPEEVVRSFRWKGKHLISGIVSAKFVDEYCHRVCPGQARIMASYEPESELRTTAAHWVRGHWRRQPYGAMQSLRKLIWIQPYQTASLLERLCTQHGSNLEPCDLKSPGHPMEKVEVQ